MLFLILKERMEVVYSVLIRLATELFREWQQSYSEKRRRRPISAHRTHNMDSGLIGKLCVLQCKILDCQGHVDTFTCILDFEIKATEKRYHHISFKAEIGFGIGWNV